MARIGIICGKSGSGKDALVKELAKEGFTVLISTTTRPMREGEVDGREYHFVSEDVFKKKLAEGRFLEHREYATANGIWYYGMEKCELDDKKYVVILDFEGAEAFQEAYKGECFTTYVDSPDAIREQWAMARGSFDRAEWDRRLEDDSYKFRPEEIDRLCDSVLVNDGKDSVAGLTDRYIARFYSYFVR